MTDFEKEFPYEVSLPYMEVQTNRELVDYFVKNSETVVILRYDFEIKKWKPRYGESKLVVYGFRNEIDATWFRLKFE